MIFFDGLNGNGAFSGNGNDRQVAGILCVIEPRGITANAVPPNKSMELTVSRFYGQLRDLRRKMAKAADRYTYRVTWSEEDDEYVGLCAEFPSLSWLKTSPEAALVGIRSLVKKVVADLKRNKESVPEPISTRSFSGKFMVRVPPEVHRLLAIQAAESGVSLNRLVSSKLS